MSAGQQKYRDRSFLLRLLLVLAGVSLESFVSPGFAAGEDGRMAFAPGTQPAKSPMFLQGGVQTIDRLPPPPGVCTARGYHCYQQGWNALSVRAYRDAADYFQLAGDQLEAGSGASRFCAEARFAEAQTRRLMGQFDRSVYCYKRAIAMFEQTDPRSFYLKAAHEALQELAKLQAMYGSQAPLTANAKANAPISGKVEQRVAASSALALKAIAPIRDIESVSKEIVLTSNVTQLDNGVSITDLKDGAFFNRSRGTLPQTAAVDVSENYVKDAVKKAFLKMNCLEMTTVAATHYSAPAFYKSITANGKAIAVGGGSDLLCPMAELRLNGKTYKVPMDLPAISPNSRNVLLLTDGKHVLALDPRTADCWKLCANMSKRIPDFNWWKLGRQKGRKIT